MLEYIPVLEIFLGFLAFGLSIMFCTTFCRACSRLREEQIEREAQLRSEQNGRPPPIYFIPFARGMSQDSEDGFSGVRYNETQTPPQYASAMYCGPPPAYNELGFKPEDLPPAYTEYNTPLPPSDVESQSHPHLQSQP